MTDTVFVLHGVGNRGREAVFRSLVAALAAATGLPMEPVYWGDLAAEEADVQSVVPAVRVPAEVRGEATLPRAGTRGGPAADRALDVVADGIRERLGDAASSRRLGLLMAEVEAYWPEADNLPEADDAVLTELGVALAEIFADTADGEFVREFDLALVRRWLVRFDRMVGATQTSVLGRLNSSVRIRLLPGVARFLGDVLVYQRHQTSIQQRVRDVIQAVRPGAGSEGEPVRLLAHSLGGVIAMDLATGRDPLWVRSLVTFGSQWPLFHLVDPRGGQVAPHNGAGPVRLPPSVAAWTNVWEPLDPLAFVTAGRYLLHDGAAPRDEVVPHLARWGIWTHSAYWHSPDFRKLLGRVFGTGEEYGQTGG
ncbi:MAG TPA: hypothetical protein VJT49_34675 [Amycolatopsis sp.]|uniref:hypothetical protein n=1 Tax=Amycolatopsis sp. TaxID=37632 RepID=UPI002B460A1D|nr:hypothetical protein [Amycolatopsis sp.]HKS50166.1 hypothetical protein [Amycolatopsis sp.]